MLPLKPSTADHITTVLPAIDIVDDGASYNPSFPNYVKYVSEIANEELNLEREENKLRTSMRLPPSETFITPREKLEEEMAGLFGSEDSNDDEEIDEEIENSDLEEQKLSSCKRKTSKDRKRERLRKKQSQLEEASKNQKNEENLIFATRRINKEIEDDLQKKKERVAKRQKRKLLNRYTTRARLGRGKYKSYEKEFLMADELPGSLRQIKPQGNILLERLKSLQKRNMLPVPGEKRQKSKLKKKLRFKLLEKRKHKEVTIGSRVV